MCAWVAGPLRVVRLWAGRVRARAQRLGRGWGRALRIPLGVVAFTVLVDEGRTDLRLAAAAVLCATLTWPVWRAPHHGEPEPLRLRSRQRRIAWRATCVLLFAAVAVRLEVGPGAAASALALGCVVPPLVDPLVWRAWPASIRSAARRARGGQRYLEVAIGPGRLWPQRRRSDRAAAGAVAARPAALPTARPTAQPNWRPAGTRRPRRRPGAAPAPFLPPGAPVTATVAALGGFDPDAGAAGRPSPLPGHTARRRKGPAPDQVDCRSHQRLLRWTPEHRELKLHHPAGQLVLPVVGAPAPDGGVRAALARHPVAELVLYEEFRADTPTWRRTWLALLDAEGYRVLELPGWGSDWAAVGRLADEAGLAFARYLLPGLAREGLDLRGPVSRTLFPWRPLAWLATRRFRSAALLDKEQRASRGW